MAQDEDPKDTGTGTNALLAQILDTDKKILVVLTSMSDGSAEIAKAILMLAAAAGDAATTNKAILKVEMDSKALLQQISDALTGGGDQHTYTVLVERLADKISSRINK